MEMQAVIEGMDVLKQHCKVKIYTDSTYVMKGITEWIGGWKARGWMTKNKKPVKNVDLWQQLDEALRGHDVSWQWVKGHSGNSGNERADTLAREAIPR
jgi:ribonuclease HI